MRKTFFNKNVTWMYLRNMTEYNLLVHGLHKNNYPTGVCHFEETEDGILVWVEKPVPFHGENYYKWEKIKSHIYAFRRSEKLLEEH